MGFICKIILQLFIVGVSIVPIYGGEIVDTVYVYYARGSSDIDVDIRRNKAVLEDLANRLKNGLCDSNYRLSRIRMTGHASPDGVSSLNVKLTENRVIKLLDYLKERGITIPDTLLSVTAQGIDWDGLATFVSDTPAVPCRDEVLEILKNVPEWIVHAGKVVDGRKRRFGMLQGGVPYYFLYRRVFPELRNVCIELFYQEEVSEEKEKEKQTEQKLPQDTVIWHEMEFRGDSVREQEAKVSYDPYYLKREDDEEYRLALKTNLLYDAILMPSLEVEYRFNNRWSANLEGEVAWWSNNSKHKYYQIAVISPEVRYWFFARKPWHGHYVGFFAGGSWYDLENGGRGYQGEAVITGFSYGYMFPVNRRLSFEASVGLGFMHTSYEEYLPIDGHYVYQRTRKTDYLGPLKLKFALVWRLWRKGGER